MTQYDDSSDAPSSSVQILVQLLMIMVVLFGVGIALVGEFVLDVPEFATGGVVLALVGGATFFLTWFVR